MDHSYEEIRACAIDILSRREKFQNETTQYGTLEGQIAELFDRRESVNRERSDLSRPDKEIFREVFWSLFRQGIIVLGKDQYNPEYPWFKVTQFGKKLFEQNEDYFFHDVSSYEEVIRKQIPEVDDVTIRYLKEAAQTFFSGCLLSSTVMLGVAIEDTFLNLIDCVLNNPSYAETYKNVAEERTLLGKFNKFRKILDANKKALPRELKEDLDTHFASILTMIRNFRNESGHPSGKFIDRNQTFVLLHLFTPCCKKMYQLMQHFKL